MKSFWLGWLAWAALGVVSITSMSGCTEREVAAGIRGAIIGAAVVIALSDPGPGYRCDGTYRVCRTHTDYWGNRTESCRTDYNRCYPMRRRMSLEDKTDMTANDWALQFGMSFEGADRLKMALDQAGDGSLAGIWSLGLSNDDLDLMRRYRLPTRQGLENLAQSLDQDVSATESMLGRLLKTAQDQWDMEYGQQQI